MPEERRISEFMDSVALVWNDLHNSSVPQMLNDSLRGERFKEKKQKIEYT